MTDLPVPAPNVIAELAPTGVIRAAINVGNPVLAHRSADGGTTGISVELARELGRWLGRPVQLVIYDGAGDVVHAVDLQAWDIAFLAIDPGRAEKIAYTTPYVTIEGTYAVARDDIRQSAAEFDADGVRIAAALHAAYELHLSRTLQHAELVRTATLADADDLMIAGKVTALSGIRHALDTFVAANDRFRVLPDHFMIVRQAMATPRRNTAGVAFMQVFIEAMQTSGFLARLGI